MAEQRDLFTGEAAEPKETQLVHGKTLIIKHYQDDKGRLVFNCRLCKKYTRCGGKVIRKAGLKWVLRYLKDHAHDCGLSPLEMFRHLVHYKPMAVALAEVAWAEILRDKLLEAAGVKKGDADTPF